MRRWSPVYRVRAVTAAIAGTIMAVAVLGLVVVNGTLALGFLAGAALVPILATAAVAAWRAEEAVATRSPLRWAWGSSWRALLVSAVGFGVVMGVVFGRAAMSAPPPDPASGPQIGGFQVGIVLTLVYAPVPLLFGTVAHLCAALTVRRAVRRWWTWFAD